MTDQRSRRQPRFSETLKGDQPETNMFDQPREAATPEVDVEETSVHNPHDRGNTPVHQHAEESVYTEAPRGEVPNDAVPEAIADKVDASILHAEVNVGDLEHEDVIDATDEPIEYEPQLGEDYNVNFNIAKELMSDVTPEEVEKMRIYTNPFASYNADGVGWTASLLDAGNNWDDETPPQLMSLFAPKYIFSERFQKGNYTNDLQHAGKSIGPQRPRIGQGGELKGASAIELIKRKTTGGGTISFPLPHSGFWLTVTPPVETELVDLDHSILMSATQVGNSTFGLLLNSRSGVFSRLLIEFALSKVTNCSLKLPEGFSTENILPYIDPLDYGIIINYLLASMYMKGYPWDFTCTSSDCKAKRSTLINLARAVWFDESAINETQRELLLKARNSCRTEDVERYRREFQLIENNHVELNGIRINFKISSMEEFLTSSDRWIKFIEDCYTRVLGNYTTEAKRGAYINAKIQATRMGRYRHMVESIEVDDVLISDYDTVTEALDNISSITEDWNIFENAVLKFIEDSTVAIVGIPSHTCTTCGFEPTEQKGRFKAIIPIAPDRCFFTLIQQQAVMMSKLAEE